MVSGSSRDSTIEKKMVLRDLFQWPPRTMRKRFFSAFKMTNQKSVNANQIWELGCYSLTRLLNYFVHNYNFQKSHHFGLNWFGGFNAKRGLSHFWSIQNISMMGRYFLIMGRDQLKKSLIWNYVQRVNICTYKCMKLINQRDCFVLRKLMIIYDYNFQYVHNHVAKNW